MVADGSVLVALVALVDRIPLAGASRPRRQLGRPVVYSERLFLKALVIRIVKHLHTVHALLAVLDDPPRRCAGCARRSPKTAAIHASGRGSGG